MNNPINHTCPTCRATPGHPCICPTCGQEHHDPHPTRSRTADIEAERRTPLVQPPPPPDPDTLTAQAARRRTLQNPT